MSEPIYKVYLVRPKASWFELSQEERTSQMAKNNDALEKVGGKKIVACNSGWSSEQWPYFGVEEFPDIEAVQKFSEELSNLNWPYQFADVMSVLGTEWKG